METPVVTVFVNDQAVTVPLSATVEMAVLAASQQLYHDLTFGPAYLTDALGHPVGEQGAVFAGMRLYVRYPKR